MLFQTRGRLILDENFVETLFKSILSGPKHGMIGDSGSLSTVVDTSGTDYIDSLYFGGFEDIETVKEENNQADNATLNMSGIDYIDTLYFGGFLDSRSALNENKSYNNFSSCLTKRTDKNDRGAD